MPREMSQQVGGPVCSYVLVAPQKVSLLHLVLQLLLQLADLALLLLDLIVEALSGLCLRALQSHLSQEEKGKLQDSGNQSEV